MKALLLTLSLILSSQVLMAKGISSPSCRTAGLAMALASSSVKDLNDQGMRIENIVTYTDNDTGFGTAGMSSLGDACVRIETAQFMTNEQDLVFVIGCEDKAGAEVPVIRSVKLLGNDPAMDIDQATAAACGI